MKSDHSLTSQQTGQETGSVLSERKEGFSLQWLLLWWSTGSRQQTPVAVAVGSRVLCHYCHGLCYSTTLGIFPDHGLNQCPLHCKADSSPRDYQGNPEKKIFYASGMGSGTQVEYKVSGLRAAWSFPCQH